MPSPPKKEKDEGNIYGEICPFRKRRSSGPVQEAICKLSVEQRKRYRDGTFVIDLIQPGVRCQYFDISDICWKPGVFWEPEQRGEINTSSGYSATSKTACLYESAQNVIYFGRGNQS